ncbi:nitrite reductase small subunit NirD [Pseudoroseicyclus sp. H15]
MNVALHPTDIDWRHVGTIDDIPAEGARRVEAGPIRIAVFRTTGDRIFALEDKCPHKNGPLSQGIVHDGCVTCPLHNWVISLASGNATGADEGHTRTFPVRLDGRDIYLNLQPGA